MEFGNLKSSTSGKHLVFKNSEPFTNFLLRNLLTNEKSMNSVHSDIESNKMGDKKHEEVSIVSVNVRGAIPFNLISSTKFPRLGFMVPFGVSQLCTRVAWTLVPSAKLGKHCLAESVLTKVVEEFEQHIASQVELKKTTPKIRLFRKATCLFSNIFLVIQRYLLYLSVFTLLHSFVGAESLKQTVYTKKAEMQSMQMKFHEEVNNLGLHLHIHGLAHSASGYQRVLEENHKLCNQLQDLKGSITVYCRVRPFLAGKSNCSSTVDNIEEGPITIIPPSKHGKGRRPFNFNKVFGPSATQEERKDTFRYEVSVQMIEIYNEQVRDLLVTDGLNKGYPLSFASAAALKLGIKLSYWVEILKLQVI
ncbi:unnamed protein product [Ilex paraguariensis]|uniref:Spindle pole body-associated protein Vik1/Cik1 microtubule binding domain-containing protein n=1 Tax=Ilex paraguariensis TaxID=185542 RepID=A0ABC8QXL4_9AQUA